MTLAAGKNTSPNNELNGSAVASAQLSRPRAVTIFAVNGDEMQEQKSRQPCGRKSSFSSNALGEMILAMGSKTLSARPVVLR